MTQTTKRDLMDALPRYYDDSPEVDAIMGADATEIDRVRTSARDVISQQYVSTATHGLDDWERVLAMSPRPNSTLAFRRNRILARLNGSAPATVANLTEVVNAHVAGKGSWIEEINAEYRFNIVMHAYEAVDIIGLYAEIDELKPAHLNYSLTQVSVNPVYFAMAVTAGEEIVVYPWSPSNIEVTTTIGLGAIVQDFDTTSVYPKQV